MPIPFASVAEYKAFQRVTGSSLDTYYESLLTYVTAYIQRYCNQFLSEQTNVVEYAEGRGVPYIVLRQRPVIAITQLYFDPRGGYGQLANTFGADTLQTAGSDYSLKFDSYDVDTALQWSRCAIVHLNRGQGMSGWTRPGNRLGYTAAASRGTIKIVYDCGFPDALFPSELILATMLLTRALEMTAKNAGWGISAESTKYYNYTLSAELNSNLQVTQLLSAFKGMGQSLGV